MLAWLCFGGFCWLVKHFVFPSHESEHFEITSVILNGNYTSQFLTYVDAEPLMDKYRMKNLNNSISSIDLWKDELNGGGTIFCD
jgi:hypothetical protein